MHYQKILIIQTAFLGDVILITPFIRATKKLFPDALIDVLVIPQTKGVLTNNPHIRNILTFDKRKNKLGAFWKTVREMRENRYDLAISPHSSTTTAYLMLLAGIKQRLGFDRWHASKYLTLKVPHLENIHKTEKNLHLLSVFTNRIFTIQTELYADTQMMTKAEEMIKKGHFKNRPTIAMAPGSIWDTKRWPEVHYVRLAEMLHQARFNLLFVGAKEERALCEQIIQKAGVVSTNLAGETNILESAAVIGHCKLMICNDSGAMHIANAMQTDVFAFFGPTVQSIGYFPYRKNDVVFERDMDCRPCSSHGGEKCPLGHHLCMKEILPEVAFTKIVERFPNR